MFQFNFLGWSFILGVVSGFYRNCGLISLISFFGYRSLQQNVLLLRIELCPCKISYLINNLTVASWLNVMIPFIQYQSTKLIIYSFQHSSSGLLGMRIFVNEQCSFCANCITREIETLKTKMIIFTLTSEPYLVNLDF